MIETQMAVKAKQVSELETQAEYLQRTAPEKMDEIQVKKTQVEMRFEQLKAPLLDRQRQLEKKKEAFQVRFPGSHDGMYEDGCLLNCCAV
jgi:spectrin beta